MSEGGSRTVRLKQSPCDAMLRKIEQWSTSVGRRVYPAAKIAVVVDGLAAEGVSVAAALQGTSIAPDELRSPTTLVSVNQVIGAYRNALRLSRDPNFAFLTGLRTHVASYGMYGFAILGSMDFAKPCSLPSATISSRRRWSSSNSPRRRGRRYGPSTRSRIRRSTLASTAISSNSSSASMSRYIATSWDRRFIPPPFKSPSTRRGRRIGRKRFPMPGGLPAVGEPLRL